MKKYERLKWNDTIYRVLEVRDGRALVLDCTHQTMPVWMDSAVLATGTSCEEDVPPERSVLSAEQRRIMQERFTMIAPILPVLAEEAERSRMIAEAAEDHSISRQTIRRYLCSYLAAMDMTALAPAVRQHMRELTHDEKNMRWALNKFFYTRKRNSLKTAYTLMLKERYSSFTGELSERYPSFYQFRYFYRKTRKLQNFHISRDGLSDYQRNHRPLTGDGVQEFAPVIGTGMLDATVCDIYLVDDAGNIAGRPILTACVDAYSSLRCGYSLSWEGGVYSLRGLLLNIIADKKDWCEQFGISLPDGAWNCNQLPGVFVTDMGKEYTSETFEQITELGVRVVNLPPYRPELKGTVEKFFDLVQETYKKHLRGKGVIEPDFGDRGAHDYRLDACLTMRDFEKIVLYCILYYNCERILEKFPYTAEMLAAGIRPHASDIWNHGKSQMGANLISVDETSLILTLLPRSEGKFCRDGLHVNKLRYHCDGFTERYLGGGMVVVAYNPEDVTSVWLFENGIYTEFALIESRFQKKSLSEVETLQKGQNLLIKASEKDNLQAQIRLAHHIGAIADCTDHSRDVHLKEIRSTRTREQNKQHHDYMREETFHD